MPTKEAPINHLQNYLPPLTFDAVAQYLHNHKIHLTVTKYRKTILGDYRHRTGFNNHRISVNGNLNHYSFLITLLHEIAHLLNFEQFGNKVNAHGREWKIIYGGLLKQFLEQKVFPADIENELIYSLKNPAASSCAEDGLVRVLRKYDIKNNGYKLVEEIALNGFFKLEDGKIYRRQEKQRKRYRCIDIKTGKVFLFSPVFEVEEVLSD